MQNKTHHTSRVCVNAARRLTDAPKNVMMDDQDDILDGLTQDELVDKTEVCYNYLCLIEVAAPPSPHHIFEQQQNHIYLHHSCRTRLQTMDADKVIIY